MQPDEETTKVEKAPLTPAQVIARHERMANGCRSASRVNDSAVAHCDRLVAEVRKTLRKDF